MRRHNNRWKFLPFGWMQCYSIIFITLFIVMYGGIAEAINLSHINIPETKGEVTERHIISHPQKSIIIIGERHDSIQIQKNIAQILKGIRVQYSQIDLIGLEGAYRGQRVENPFSSLPSTIKGLDLQEIERIKEEIAKGLLETGEISAVEFIGMISDVNIYGVEDRDIYTRNKRQALSEDEGSGKDLQGVVSEIREGLEDGLNERLSKGEKERLDAKKKEVNGRLLDYLKETDKEGIGRLYNLLLEIENGKVNPERLMSDFRSMFREYGIYLNPETASSQKLQESLSNLMIKMQETINERLTPEQLEEMAKIQGEIDTVLGEIDDEIHKFNLLLKGYKDQTCIKGSLKLLRYLREKSGEFGIAFPSSIDSQIEFYTTALKRDEVMVENLLNTMKNKNKTDAVLLVGAAHICGITERFKDRRISFVVVIPKGMKDFSKDEEEIYRHTLEGKALPSSLFELWSTSHLKPPPRSSSPIFRDYERALLGMSVVYKLKAKGYSNREIRDRIGGLAQGDHYGADLDEIIYSLGDVYIPFQIRDNRGVLRLSQYPIDINKRPVSPVLRHGKIGKLFYEFIDRGDFNGRKEEIIAQNNKRNIASSPLDSDVIEIIFKGRKNKGGRIYWMFDDGEENGEVEDDRLEQMMSGYGGGGKKPPVTITFQGDLSDPRYKKYGDAWGREDATGDLFRRFGGLGFSAYITSDPKLIAKRKKEKQPIVLPGGGPNITFIEALPEGQGSFRSVREELNLLQQMGFPVIDISDFNGNQMGNILVIIGHTTHQLLRNIEEFSDMGYFRDKVVGLIMCQEYGEAEFLKTIDKITKQGGLEVTSFETIIEDKEAGSLLNALRDMIQRGNGESLSLSEAIDNIDIQVLRNNIRRDVFLEDRNKKGKIG
ncbi:MAG: hypothetical protein ACE5EA_10760 [Nitrospirota bacterium]